MAAIKEFFSTSIGRGEIWVLVYMKKADLYFVFSPYYSERHVVTKENVQPSLDGGYERIDFNYRDETKPIKLFPFFSSH